MKLFSVIMAVCCLSGMVRAYDASDFLKDAKSDPLRIFSSLHPAAKDMLSDAVTRAKENESYCQEVLYGMDVDASALTERSLWLLLWRDSYGDEYFQEMVYVDSLSVSQGDLQIHVFEDPSYKLYGGLYDTFVFKKHGDSYLPMLPEMMVVVLSTGDSFADTSDFLPSETAPVVTNKTAVRTDAALLKALQSDKIMVRLKALNELDEKDAVSADFIPMLSDIITLESSGQDPLVLSAQLKATLVFAKIGERAIPSLKQFMQDSETRWSAVGILERMGDQSVDALPELMGALHDENESIRYLAAKAIMHLGPRARDAVPDLIETVSDEYDSAREFAMKALGEMGEYGEPALPILRDASQHINWLTRACAEDAIEKIEAALAEQGSD